MWFDTTPICMLTKSIICNTISTLLNTYPTLLWVWYLIFTYSLVFAIATWNPRLHMKIFTQSFGMNVFSFSINAFNTEILRPFSWMYSSYGYTTCMIFLHRSFYWIVGLHSIKYELCAKELFLRLFQFKVAYLKLVTNYFYSAITCYIGKLITYITRQW